jgi:hypothetical protein
MAVNYLWDCTRVDAYPVENEHQDVVYKVHWSIIGESDPDLAPNGMPYQASIVGIQELGPPGIDDFTPFESLTNVVVTDWVIAAMGTEAVDALKLAIDNQINEQINPTSLSLIIGQ